MRRLVLFIDNILARVLSILLRWLPLRTRRVRCLLLHGDEMLLVINRLSHKGQRWSLPGGGIKNGESVKEAAAREVEEELAITLQAGDIVHMGTVEYAHGKFVEQLEVVVARTDSQTFTRQKLELIDARWFPVTAPPENTQGVVDEAIKTLNSKT